MKVIRAKRIIIFVCFAKQYRNIKNPFRELSFKKGDIIYIRREIDKNWFEGEHNATVGLLPSNYVEVGNKMHLLFKKLGDVSINRFIL